MLPIMGKAVHLKQIVPRDLCRTLIRETEQIGYKTALVHQRDESKRLYLCAELNRSSLAIKLMELCRAYIPSELKSARYTGLHTHLRFIKYRDTDSHFFAFDDTHSDRSVKAAPPPGTRSLLTLQVYLNDDYAGGETSLRRLRESTDDRADWRDVRPIHTGDVLLFDHALVHRTNPVTLGTKYTLQTDMLYTS
jgi:hypothetical protein